MNYSELDVDQIISEVLTAKEQGMLRPATKQETTELRLAALSAIVHEMQVTVQNDKNLAHI